MATVTGNGSVSLDGYPNHVLDGLTVYGKSVQDGTPTPDAPVPIRCVRGRNLLDVETNVLANSYLNGSTGLVAYASSQQVFFCECMPNTTYTLAKTMREDGIDRYSYAYTTEEPGIGTSIYGAVMVQGSNATAYAGQRVARTITTGSDAKYIVWWAGGPNNLFDNDYAQAQIEHGSTAHDYVPYGNLAITTSDGQVSYLDLQGNELHGLSSTYRDTLDVDASGHAVITKRTFGGRYTGADGEPWSAQGTYKSTGGGFYQLDNKSITGYDATSHPERNIVLNTSNSLCSHAAIANMPASADNTGAIGYGNGNTYPRYRFYEESEQSLAAWKEWLAENPVNIILPLHSDMWYTVDLGYVELPDVRESSTLSIGSEVSPDVTAELVEYSTGGGASMSSTNLLRFTGRPTYAGENTAANRANGWCRWNVNGTGSRTEDDDGIQHVQSGTNPSGFVIPLCAEGVLNGGSDEVLTLSFQYKSSLTPSKFPIYLLNLSGGNVVRNADVPQAAAEWTEYTYTFYFPDNSSKTSYSILVPYVGTDGYTFAIKDATCKLELGDTATPWTPSPFDGDGYGTPIAIDEVMLSEGAAVAEQPIYIQAESAASTPSVPTSWVTATGESVNVDTTGDEPVYTCEWTTKHPTYVPERPVTFVATQRRRLDGTVTCSTPLPDDTTTIIDGGHITTGVIDASEGRIIKIDAGAISTGTLDAERIDTSSLGITITHVAGLSDDLATIEQTVSDNQEEADKQLGALATSMAEQSTSLSGDIAALKEQVEEQDQSHSDRLTAIETHIEFTEKGSADDGTLQPVMVMNAKGVGTSNLEMQLTNSELGFYDEGTKVSWLSDKVMHNSELEVSGQATLGKFAFVPLSDDSLAFKWVG